MFPDPLGVFFCIACLCETFYTFQDQAGELEAYEDLLNRISDLISDLESDRHRLSRGLISGGWVSASSDIKAAKSVLESAQRQAVWRYGRQGQWSRTISIVGKRDSIAFALRQEVIIQTRASLTKQEIRLLEIRSGLSEAEEKLTIWELYCRCTAEKTSREMTKRFVSQMTMFMGMGELSSNCARFSK